MVDKLLKYVEEQLSRGYKPDVIKGNLIREGYSPALIDGVLESVMMKTSSGKPVPLGVSHEKSVFPKLILVFLFLVVVILGAVFLPSLLKAKQALLDITAEPDKLTYVQGEKLGFNLGISNMGSAERFDTTLIYRLLDSNDNTIFSREETIAISTSTSHYRTIELSDTLRPGLYTLKVFANYDGKVATSSFSFNVEEKPAPVIETCNDGVQNQDELGVDCGGVCGGYWYDNRCHLTPRTEPEPEEASCNDGVQNQDEVGPDCGGICGGYWYDGSCHTTPEQEVSITQKPSLAETMINARTIAKTNPAEAKNICFTLENIEERDRCLKAVAQTSMMQEYCDLIEGVDDRDECYYPFFIQGDYSVCEKLTDPQSKEACEQLRELSIIAEQLNQTTN